MAEHTALERMRADWNERAREDAFYYVAFGRRDQDSGEFLATAADVVRSLEAELKRLGLGDRRARRALEIGCGPGRLMLPMSWNFGEVHGVDVSDGMIRLATRLLQDTPNTFPRLTSGADLASYGGEMFDFVYSYAVFQHIPSREVVFSYLREARRVLKPGGILRCQINGLPPTAQQYSTWSGVRIGASEVAEFARREDLQLLALEGASTQYMWTTLRKQPPGWFERISESRPAASARVRSVCNAQSGEAVVPAGGRFASISAWVENLPPDCDLNALKVLVDGQPAAPVYIGPQVFDGLCQVNALLPPGMRTGLAPVELEWFGEPLGDGWIRVIPPGPAVPRIVAVTDGVNLLSRNVIVSRSVKLCLEDLAAPDQLRVSIDGSPAEGLDLFCTNPSERCYEANFDLPAAVAAGLRQVEVRVGRRRFAPLEIEVRG
ncbi:MAG: methyltransferase domain-containing protein [Candidatus Solibacter usitatus]|nr:methyltransferase domain-containing protein [Candidatus Solibacter usitatus]